MPSVFRNLTKPLAPNELKIRAIITGSMVLVFSTVWIILVLFDIPQDVAARILRDTTIPALGIAYVVSRII